MHILITVLKILSLSWVSIAAGLSFIGLVYLICDAFKYRYRIFETCITIGLLLFSGIVFSFLAYYILTLISPVFRLPFMSFLD